MIKSYDSARSSRIIEIGLLLEELKQEQRMADWLNAHPGATVSVTHNPDGCFYCCLSRNGQFLARAVGNTEGDARAHAFSHVFLGEAAE